LVHCFISFLSSYLFVFLCNLPFLTLSLFLFYYFIFLNSSYSPSVLISPLFFFLFFAVVLYTLFSFYLSPCIGFCLSLPLSFLLRHLVLRICKVKNLAGTEKLKCVCRRQKGARGELKCLSVHYQLGTVIRWRANTNLLTALSTKHSR